MDPFEPKLTPFQQIHRVCNRLTSNAGASTLNICRADLRKVAEAVKAMELALSDRGQSVPATPAACEIVYPARWRVGAA